MLKVHSNDRHNNFNLLRLAGAIFVVFSHSFALVGLVEPLFFGWTTFGSVGVFAFFVISGYLIIQSWDRDPHLFRYLVRRSLRIFPALFVCIILTVLVLGPALTSLPLSTYFTHPFTTEYLTNIVLVIRFSLPGVFHDNPYQYAVNGALWSLPIEFCMYVALAMLALVFNRLVYFLIVALMSASVTALWALDPKTPALAVLGSDVRMLFICGTYFWFGVVLYKVQKLRNLLNWSTTAVSTVALIVTWMLEPAWLNFVTWVLFPLILIQVGSSRCPAVVRRLSRFDISYGLYIYAFPIQQTLACLYPGIRWWEMCALTLVLGSFAGGLSWKLVERPSLDRKPRLTTEATWPVRPRATGLPTQQNTRAAGHVPGNPQH